MKMFSDLTASQKEAALQKTVLALLDDIIDGNLVFNDELNEDGLQAAIDAALQEAEDMHTPWFAGEYVMAARYDPGEGHIVEDDGLWPVSEALRSLAVPIVEDAFYPEKYEEVIDGIA